MKKLQRWTIAVALAIFVLLNLQVVPGAAADSKTAFQPIRLSEMKDGHNLFDPLFQFVKVNLQLSKEDASYVTNQSFYEVDLGNYPKGYTRQFIAFVYNNDWIELVLVTTNEDASDIKLLDRAVSSDEGELFLGTFKLDFSTEKNHIHVWSQASSSAFESNVELEWAGDAFYVVSHDYDDPTERYFKVKERLIQTKNIEGLIDQYNHDAVSYPAAYESFYTLSTPALKLAHQQALQVQKKDIKTAISYLEYGLHQYVGVNDYKSGKLQKSDIVASPADKRQLSLGAYVEILNDYGYFLSLAGRNKEAKPILANVIKLVPTRTVAYINLADVEWTLGQKSAAKAHYQQYWKLLGSKASTIAPKRVKDRMK
ncbi:tetratricopeptide repeat protein [Cohnella mopanensis]|uniref:tetratricopeptide repeat protein n=1 Tax=Cohnella mopanensis TaxID=2911966 RepID=UPI001EF7EE5F|nr:hypothetical protein [Cohnella mopanensis]